MHHYKANKANGLNKLEAKDNGRVAVLSKRFDPSTGEDLGFDDHGPEYDADIIDAQIAALTAQIEDLQELKADVAAVEEV